MSSSNNNIATVTQISGTGTDPSTSHSYTNKGVFLQDNLSSSPHFSSFPVNSVSDQTQNNLYDNTNSSMNQMNKFISWELQTFIIGG